MTLEGLHRQCIDIARQLSGEGLPLKMGGIGVALSLTLKDGYVDVKVKMERDLTQKLNGVIKKEE